MANCCSEFLIEVMNAIHHLFDAEIGADEGLAASTELGAQFWIVGEEENSFGGGVLVAEADEEAGLVVMAEKTDTITVKYNAVCALISA